jgi:hypothetical protein
MDINVRKLGASGMEITTVGFGSWAVGGDWAYGWGDQDDDDSVGAILHAVGAGVNWIDTAAAYGLGHSEEVVGRALAQLTAGERPMVFTKCGVVGDPANPHATPRRIAAPESIRRECEASLKRLRFSEGLRVGPLRKQGSDHPLGLAVGLGSVGPGPAMAKTELVTSLGEGVASVAAAVVGQDPFDRDAVSAIETPGSTQEVRSRGRRLVGQLLDIGEPAEIVDCDMNPVPADVTMATLLAPSVDAVATARSDPSELLCVQVHELAWPLTFVAHDRRSSFQAIESTQACSSEEGIHGRTRKTGLPGQNVRSDSKLTSPDANPFGQLGRVGMSLASNDASPIEQADRSFGSEPRPPFRARLAADAGGSSCRSNGPARADPLDQDRSTLRGQAGVSMRHEGPLFGCGLQHQQPNDKGPHPSTT